MLGVAIAVRHPTFGKTLSKESLQMSDHIDPGFQRPSMTAEPPLRVESREELVYLLGEACEIEHGLMCEYLYAQFSLKRTVEEGLTAEQLARVQAWEATLI